jgi:hypothetical protein
VARSINDPLQQARALAMVAMALGKAGHHQQSVAMARNSEAMARSIPDPGDQARALAAVAEERAQAGIADSASWLAAETCLVLRWTDITRLIPSLDGAAFATIARMLTTT